MLNLCVPTDQLCVQIISTFVKIGTFCELGQFKCQKPQFVWFSLLCFLRWNNFALSKFRKEKILSGNVIDLKIIQIIVNILHNIARILLLCARYLFFICRLFVLVKQKLAAWGRTLWPMTSLFLGWTFVLYLVDTEWVSGHSPLPSKHNTATYRGRPYILFYRGPRQIIFLEIKLTTGLCSSFCLLHFMWVALNPIWPKGQCLADLKSNNCFAEWFCLFLAPTKFMLISKVGQIMFSKTQSHQNNLVCCPKPNLVKILLTLEWSSIVLSQLWHILSPHPFSDKIQCHIPRGMSNLS